MKGIRYLDSPGTMGLSFAGLGMRSVTIDGQPWFVAADVCRMIGFDVGTGKSTTRYLSTLDASEKRTVKRSEPTTLDIFRSGRSASLLTLVTESGLYALVMRSDKPQAREHLT